MPKEMMEIICNVDSSWTKDQIIRYLYIKLAPFFRRDIEYFLKSPKEQIEIFKNGFSFNYKDIVCVTLCQFYADLFKEFNIDSVIVPVTKANPPLHALLVNGNSGWYYLDPLSDLFYNQYGLRPAYFGVLVSSYSENFLKIANQYSLKQLDKKYLEELDQNFSFEYLNTYFTQLHGIFSVRNNAFQFFGLDKKDKMGLLERKVEFFDDKLINLGNVNGILERCRLYLYLIGKLFDKSEKKYTEVCCEDKQNIILKVGVAHEGDILTREYQEINDGEYHLKRIK